MRTPRLWFGGLLDTNLTAQGVTELPSMTSLLKKLRALQSRKCQFAI